MRLGAPKRSEAKAAGRDGRDQFVGFTARAHQHRDASSHRLAVVGKPSRTEPPRNGDGGARVPKGELRLASCGCQRKSQPRPASLPGDPQAANRAAPALAVPELLGAE